ncbi:hypothetical protein [uncultured Bradyrhizobium sp.]|jgi:hypothetical protein|uniref:hypothetical protein n=1 Tax=uncultured Bradyrhizobium sp. TaxID=199684 RepID=UPI00260861C8|nr:hypothetical protein [uncultured Bradyrhizobium sp.]
MKRHLVYPIHFDTRSRVLEDEQSTWTEEAKVLHRENRRRVVEGIEQQFGSRDLEQKVVDFRECRTLPFSIVSYHNRYYQQSRDAFVAGTYYPAATGACALGERILNHLVIDLREEFRDTPDYKRVYRKQSFDNWSLAIEVLSNWSALRGDTPQTFRQLNALRNILIHFDATIFDNERALALEALSLIGRLVSAQFGFFGNEHWWAIPGTRGAQFISKDAEKDVSA